MTRRTKQSNRAEYCPLCSKRLTARFAAASHYRAHVRHGEMVQRGSSEGYFEWHITGYLAGQWFTHGFTSYWRVCDKTVEQYRAEWLRKHGYAGLLRDENSSKVAGDI